jgi:hypothetical protein
MRQVRVLSYGAAEQGESDCRHVSRLDWRLEECLFLSPFGQNLFQFAVVDGIDTDAAVAVGGSCQTNHLLSWKQDSQNSGSRVVPTSTHLRRLCQISQVAQHTALAESRAFTRLKGPVLSVRRDLHHDLCEQVIRELCRKVTSRSDDIGRSSRSVAAIVVVAVAPVV